MMKVLKIDPTTRVKDVQRDFNELYPYLRLAFYKRSDDFSLQEGSVDALVPIIRLSGCAVGRHISIAGHRTVDELIAEFREVKLFVCLLRKSGQSWLTASFTGNFTLEQQNKEGEMLSAGWRAFRNDD